jgi:predicted DNA-binding protein
MVVKARKKKDIVTKALKMPKDTVKRIEEMCKIQSRKSFSQFVREAIDEKLEKSEASLEVG